MKKDTGSLVVRPDGLTSLEYEKILQNNKNDDAGNKKIAIGLEMICRQPAFRYNSNYLNIIYRPGYGYATVVGKEEQFPYAHLHSLNGKSVIKHYFKEMIDVKSFNQIFDYAINNDFMGLPDKFKKTGCICDGPKIIMWVKYYGKKKIINFEPFSIIPKYLDVLAAMMIKVCALSNKKKDVACLFCLPRNMECCLKLSGIDYEDCEDND